MSVSQEPCPPSDVLEGIASGRDTPFPLHDHLAMCEACRQSLERMREDNRFLSRFAVGGSLPSGSTPAQDYQLDIPGYEIVREIHRGGQGVVYQAVQRSTQRDVAIKVMKQGPFATLADRVRFDREVEALGRLNHPNIVAVHDAGIVAGCHFFVMNYVDGLSLDAMTDGPPESPPNTAGRDRASKHGELLRLFCKVADAVHAAHLRGIIHRDLKPSNIRIDRSGEPHVLDFGLSKSVDAPRDSVMTETGQFVGSLPWASPEQVEGQSSKIDLRTDVYSLGAMLYQLLTGTLPFDVGSNLRQSIDAILFREPQRPSAIAAASKRAAIDEELDTIVLKCISKDRERRYQSAGDLARDLRHYLAGEAIEAKRDSAIYMLRKTLTRYRVRVAFAGAFVVMLAVFGVVMAFLYRHSVRLEHDAVRSAASLAELLSSNNIEQGRMAGLLGNMEQAERLLWGELLTHRVGGQESAIRLNDPPGPPEAYWALWEVYRRQPCFRTVTPQPPAMRTATMSDDGKSLWTGDSNGFVQRIDEVGARLDSYQVAFPNAIGLPFIDAHGTFVFKYDKRRYMVWRRGAGDRSLIELPKMLNVDAGSVFATRSGRRFAAVIDGGAAVWSTDPPAELARFVAEGVDLNAVAISNDDRRLAARDHFGGLHVWDIESKNRLVGTRASAPSREFLHNGGAIVFSPDDRRIADGWEEANGRIWDLRRDPPTFMELSERPGSHRLQCFSPNGDLLAVGDLEGRLRIFDSRTGQCRVSFVAHAARVRSVAFTGDGRGVWTCGNDDLRLWEVATDAGTRVVRVNGESFHSVAITPDGRWLTAGGGTGTLHRFGLANLSKSTLSFGNESNVSCVAVSRDGRRTVASTYGNAAYLWNSDDLNRPPVKIPHPQYVSDACFSPDGARVATACDDGSVRVWRCDDQLLEREFHAGEDRVPQVTFDPHDGRRLAGAVRNGALLVWNLETGECETWQSATYNPLRAVRFSPDGRWLYAAGADRMVEIWDAARGRREGALVGHNQEIFCLDVSEDGEWIASGDAGGVIRLWHAALRRPLATLDGHAGSVMALSFAPDGRSLVSASLDGTVRVWDLTYYARHIKGNLATQLTRLGAIDPADGAKVEAWRRWAGLAAGE